MTSVSAQLDLCNVQLSQKCSASLVEGLFIISIWDAALTFLLSRVCAQVISALPRLHAIFASTRSNASMTCALS